MKCEFCTGHDAHTKYIYSGSPDPNDFDKIHICNKCEQELDLKGENE